MLLLYSSIAVAVLNWIFTGRQSLPGIYLTKPLVMILLISWMAREGWGEGNPDLFPLIWFVAALVFCMGGDVFLMLGWKWFRPGLAFFLIGHLFYIRGFSQWINPGNHLPGTVILIILIILVGVSVARKLFDRSSALNLRSMRIPILLYSVVISTMLFTALSLLFDPSWPRQLSGLVSFGAVCFYLSDLMNAWHRFVRPIRYGGVWIMCSYHAAQICITVGITMFLSHGAG